MAESVSPQVGSRGECGAREEPERPHHSGWADCPRGDATRGRASPPYCHGPSAPLRPTPVAAGNGAWCVVTTPLTRLLTKATQPQRGPGSDQHQDQQLRIHEGQDRSSSYGHRTGGVEPHSQGQYSDQSGKDARSQTRPLAFRCNFTAAEEASLLLIAFGGLCRTNSRVVIGTCS